MIYEIAFKRLKDNAIIPWSASRYASGADLYATETVDIRPGGVWVVGCGFAMSMPTGLEAQIRPRSGLAAKHGVTVLNTPGTIDADYRGEVKVILINHGNHVFRITVGDRIAQMVFAPVTSVTFNLLPADEELSTTERGEGGFGSTGER